MASGDKLVRVKRDQGESLTGRTNELCLTTSVRMNKDRGSEVTALQPVGGEIHIECEYIEFFDHLDFSRARG